MHSVYQSAIIEFNSHGTIYMVVVKGQHVGDYISLDDANKAYDVAMEYL